MITLQKNTDHDAVMERIEIALERVYFPYQGDSPRLDKYDNEDGTISFIANNGDCAEIITQLYYNHPVQLSYYDKNKIIESLALGYAEGVIHFILDAWDGSNDAERAILKTLPVYMNALRNIQSYNYPFPLYAITGNPGASVIGILNDCEKVRSAINELEESHLNFFDILADDFFNIFADDRYMVQVKTDVEKTANGYYKLSINVGLPCSDIWTPAFSVIINDNMTVREINNMINEEAERNYLSIMA